MREGAHTSRRPSWRTAEGFVLVDLAFDVIQQRAHRRLDFFARHTLFQHRTQQTSRAMKSEREAG